MPFLKHEACPNCRALGKDRTGNNLARYTNGSAHCFSCRYWEPPTGYIPKSEKAKEIVAPPNDLCSHFNGDNLRWLKKYLTDFEIMDHFKYSPSMKRHVYKYADYWEARSVDPAHVKDKCISHGVKPYNLLGKGDTIVVVEDIVSAIKVSRVARSLPLFGAYLSPDFMVRLVKERPKQIVIWLDEDKWDSAMQYAAKINTLAPIARAVKTRYDPKDHTDFGIKEVLKI